MLKIVERYRRAMKAADALSLLLKESHPLGEGGKADWRRDPKPGDPDLASMAADVSRWLAYLRNSCGKLNAEVKRLEVRGMRVKVGELTEEAFASRMAAAGCSYTPEALAWIHGAAAYEEFDPEALVKRYSQLAAEKASALADGSVVCALSRDAA